MRRGWFLFFAVALGCAATAYRCDSTHTCGAGSTCTPAGYCAERVATSLCPSGLRYTGSAAAPGTCVTPVDASTDTPPDDVTDVTAQDKAPPDDVTDVTTQDEALLDDVALDHTAPNPPFDAAVDTPPDHVVQHDGTSDVTVNPEVSTDVAAETSLDARADTPTDLPLDAALDLVSPMDARSDVPRDVVMDTPTHTARDVPLESAALPDGGDGCSIRALAPLSGTRVSGQTLRVRAAVTGVVRAASLQYATSPTGTMMNVSLQRSLDARFVGQVTGVSGRLYWRLVAQCGNGTNAASPRWWTWHRNAVSVDPGTLGWVPDVSGDGLVDPVIAAPVGPPGPFVRVFMSNGGATPTEDLPLSTTDHERISRVAVVPDMNGDGAAEVAVARCPRDTVGMNCVRTVIVYTRSADRWHVYHAVSMPEPTGTPTDFRGTARFGATLAGIGDFDGDGYGDLLIGAPPAVDEDAGAFYLLFGGPSVVLVGPFAVSAIRGSVPQLTRFAWSAAGVGDLNLDGHVDFVVTSRQRAWVYFGNGSRVPVPPENLAIYAQDSPSGFAVTAAGDVDQDHHADFALSRSGQTAMGSVTVVLGRARSFRGLGDDTPDSPSLSNFDPTFGISALGGLELNRAGGDDLVVNATNARLLVRVSFNGHRLVSHEYRLPPPIAARRLGVALGAVGDHDGDGVDDFAASVVEGDMSVAQVFTQGPSDGSLPISYVSTLRAMHPTFGMEIGR